MARLIPASAGDDPFAHASGAEVSPEFERACVEFFADVVQVFGVPRSVGQIYGLLYASPRSLSFTDIAETLEISRGSTSQGLQALRELGAVVSVNGTEGERAEVEGSKISASQPGNRRELFRPEFSLRKLVSGILREKVDPLVSEGGRKMDGLAALAKAAPNAAGKKFAASRVEQIETWRRQMSLLLPLLKTVLGPVKR
jgi:biotin operon repressor